MNAKIMEIFRSVQGEGIYLGRQHVFVRLFECNMHCSWCDTPASIGDTSRNYKDVPIDELFAQVQELYDNAHAVSITGGEPLIQAEFLKEFLPRLGGAGMRVYLDSNGTLPEALKKVIGHIDIVAMDLKLPSSTGERSFWAEHEAFLRIARRSQVFIKVVISMSTSIQDLQQAVGIVQKTDSAIPFILQPNYFDMKEGSVAKCLELEKYCSKFLADVRIIPQMHKFLRVP